MLGVRPTLRERDVYFPPLAKLLDEIEEIRSQIEDLKARVDALTEEEQEAFEAEDA